MYSPRKYPSKILLTGEYTVLLAYPAIAIPWPARFAQWKENGTEPESTLEKFYHFLSNHDELKNYFQLDDFNEFILKYGYLESNIPFGYGLGSSGTFCAAVYDRFGITDKNDLIFTHDILRKLESFFHGQSSGLDPMVSYYDRAIQINNGKISFPEIEAKNLLSKHNLFLVDSKLKRDTEQLVSAFKESIKDKDYKTKISDYLVPINDLLMNALLNDDSHKFNTSWVQLSILSLETFRNMIPGVINDFWKAGIESKSYYCKLCGAGGGGLFLVKVDDLNHFEEQLGIFGLEIFA